ncbi:hypothetical protein DV738_g5576, partial [Chaetothyriales sp. CBS 135597]
MASRKTTGKKIPDLPTSADEIVPFSHRAAGHEGISTSASGSVLIKPCTQHEIDFYRSAATDPRHEFFYAHMPTFYGDLKIAANQVQLGPLLSEQGGVAPLPAPPLPETDTAPAAEPGPATLAPPAAATTSSAPVNPTTDTWKPSQGKKLETGLAIALENAAAGFQRPCILDVKLGARLWADDAPLAKKQRFDDVAKESTSGSLGFRITGVKVWLGEDKEAQKDHLSRLPAISRDESLFTLDEQGYVGYEKQYGRKFNKDNVKEGFTTYLGGLNDQGKLQRKHAKLIRDRFIRELESIVFVLENEESRMYSASVLLVYEGDDEKLEAAQQYEDEQKKKDDDAGQEQEEVSAFPSKAGPKSPRKQAASTVSLQLRKVIGTTTSGPAGLACCASNSSFAYCAGAVAVLSTLEADGAVTTRYYKSRPTTTAVNPSRSYYDTGSPSHTPTRRRPSAFADRTPTDSDRGGAVGRERVDEGSQTWAARERIKTVTCVALNENGRWLAVGETGYMPRVLLYSTASGTPTDVPTSIISDHSIGVRTVAFSPDSRFLASLGTLTDGFLYVWSLNCRTGSLTLHSANKCTTPIADMIWCGSQLITIGTRHVKVWQPGQALPSSPQRLSRRVSTEKVASPGPATLSGRNALLGALVECNFTCAVAIRPTLVLVGTDAGHLCALNVSGSYPELKLLKMFDFEINALAWQPSRQRLVLGGQYGIAYEDLSVIDQILDSPPLVPGSRARSPRKGHRLSAARRSLGLDHTSNTGLSAVGCVSSQLIILDGDGNLLAESNADQNAADSAQTFACHNGSIQGVASFPPGSEHGAFFTWTKNGDLCFWETGGALRHKAYIRLEQQDLDGDLGQNELRIVRFSRKTSLFVAGDRFGMLQLVAPSDWNALWIGRAHGTEVTDIAIHDDSSFIATSSRDQTLQLFLHRENSLELVQTMDDHIGAVNNLLFNSTGSILLSCSADRTVFVRERVHRQGEGVSSTAYLPTRIITLRSAPLSMAFLDSKCETLLVSTMDRHITKVDVTSGTVIESSKITDPESEDRVALNRIAVISRHGHGEGDANFLVGFSSADKSLRVYDNDKILLLTREHGHTEGISDMCILEDSGPTWTLVSTGLDRTIMVWALTIAQPLSPPAVVLEACATDRLTAVNGEVTPGKCSPVSLPPLRKVLTKGEAQTTAISAGRPSRPSDGPAAKHQSSPRLRVYRDGHRADLQNSSRVL